MLRGIIFDCFGVLYVDASQYFYEHQVPGYERLRPQLMELHRAYDYGLLSQAELNQAVAELAGLSLDFVDQHIQGVHRRNQRLLDYSQSLRPQFQVGMLSNIGVGSMDSFFSKDERDSLFDAVVLSGEENITKPHPYIFRMTAERLGLTPEVCVMIDDIEENCAGADAAGMRSILYTDTQTTIQQLNRLIDDQA